MDYKNIIAAKRRKKLEDEVVDALSNPSTTSVRVKSRYKEDIDDLESRFKHQYEIKREEFPTGYSVTVIHQMKTPLEKKCEELQERLSHLPIIDISITVDENSPNILVRYKKTPHVWVGNPARAVSGLFIPLSHCNAIKREFFDDHTVEELAAAIEGLYFA